MFAVNKFSYAGNAFTRAFCAIFTIIGWDFSEKITSDVSSLGKSCPRNLSYSRYMWVSA